MNNGFHPGAGFNPGNLGFGGFRTPIIFADTEEEEGEEVEVQSVGEEGEGGPGVILLQSPAGYYPLLQTLPDGLVPATTLPAYLPGGNKQQYARGPFVQTPAGLVGVRTLPSGIVFAAEEKAAYVPGSNKQQYLRGGRPAQPQYVPLIKASNPLTGSSAGVESLPSPIVFAPAEPAAYVPGTNKQPYLRGRQTSYSPLIEVAAPGSVVPAQSLPSGLVFAGYYDGERAGYVSGANKQPYLRPYLRPTPTIAAAPPSQEERFVLLTPRRETRPAPVVAQQPFLRARQEEDQGAFFPGVSSRPSFPPGFPPRQFSTYNQQQTTDQGYGQQGPKNVLYFFK